MAHQMVYTSIKSGLVAGRSGFCTAARHREISDALVGRIEDLSGQYDRGSLATRNGGALPVIYSHRVVAIRGREWHLLMRIADAGTDYSGRTNHIAHTFVLEPQEVVGLRLTPAETILHLIRGKHWIERYTDAARYFDPEEGPDLRSFAPLASLPARRWQSETGAAATAALLMDSQAAMGVGIVTPEGNDPDLLLTLFAESQLIASPDRSKPAALWTRSFTTLMQSSEQRGDFDWYGCPLNSPLHLQMLKANRFLVELGSGLTGPKGRFADIAEGKQVAEEASVVRGRVEAVVETAPAPVGETETTAPDLVIPAASLRPVGVQLGSGHRREKRRAGLPLWVPVVGGIAGLGLVAVIAMMVFGKSEAEKYARSFEEHLRKGDWKEVGDVLEEIPEEEKRDHRENPNFKALEDTYKVARNYDWISRNDSGTTPDGSTIADISDLVGFKGSVDDVADGLAAKLPKIGVGPFPVVDTLKKGASKQVADYEALVANLRQDWESLKGGKTSGLNFEKLEGSDRERFADQIEDLEETKKIVGEFAKIREKEHESAESAVKYRDELSERVNQRLGKAQGESWTAALRGINLMIGSFEPKLRVDLPPPPENPDPNATKTEMTVETKSEELPPIPVTYFLRVNEGSTYSYQGIPELTGAFPAKPYLTARANFQISEIDEIRTDGMFVAPNIYHERDATPVFKMGTGQTLELLQNAPAGYDKCFLLALGSTKGGRPLVQIAGQVPSSKNKVSEAFAKDIDYLLEVPMDQALVKEGDGLRVSEGLGEMLRQFRTESEAAVFHLVQVGKSGVEGRWMNEKPSELKGRLSEVLANQIREVEGAISDLKSKKRVDEDYDKVFGRLGERLFCDNDEKEHRLYKLEIVEKNEKGRIQYRMRGVPDKTIDSGPVLYRTIEEFAPKNGGGRPLLIDYVNYSLYELLRSFGLNTSYAALSNDDMDFLEGNLVRVSNPDQWGPVGIGNALEGWVKISQRASDPTRKWTEGVRIDPTYDKAVAEDRVKRYPPNRYRSDFFKQWLKIFNEDNIELARKKMLGGDFNEAELEAATKRLAELKADLEVVGQKDLADMGDFYVLLEDGDVFFRVVAIR